MSRQGEKDRMKKRRMLPILLPVLLLGLWLTGCGGQDAAQNDAAQKDAGQKETVQSETVQEPQLEDGVYEAEFTTDNSMFHVSEACDGKGVLTVKDGEMTIHVSLGSKNILNLYPGLAADAEKEGAQLLEPTTDTVTYDDGMTEEVYGFDVPVPALDEEFDLALIGTKGKWYDHKVRVSDPVPQDDAAGEGAAQGDATGETGGLPEDGVYQVELQFEGGSGRAKIQSPVTVRVSEGKAVATLEWSSPNYDYMIADGEKYLPVNTEGNSVFEIPVPAFDTEWTVIGDTVAMSTPHEVEYTLVLESDTMQPVEE